MALVYRSICNEIDDLIIRIIHLAEKEIRYKIEIEKLMNTGFIDIAKARYIMGSTCVTKMQLPTGDSNEINAVATVCRTPLNDHWIFHIHRKDTNSTPDCPESSEFKTENKLGSNSKEHLEGNNEVKTVSDAANKPDETEAESETCFRKMLQNNLKGLKKSKNAFNVDDDLYMDYNEELLDEMSTDSSSNETVISVTDPIRLFGVLVPNSLKQAQSVFKDVISLLGSCATLQSELSKLLSRYDNLQMVRGLIEEVAKDIKMDISKPKVYWTPSEVSSESCPSIEQYVGGEEEDLSSGVSVQKSIRSVFYDLREFDTKEADMSLWGSEVDKNNLDDD